MMPVLTAEATLVRRDGAVIWQKSEAVFPASADYKGYPWKEFMQNPERLRGSFRQAAELLADRLAWISAPKARKTPSTVAKTRRGKRNTSGGKEEKAARRARRR
jgi:hypothetical protein